MPCYRISVLVYTRPVLFRLRQTSGTFLKFNESCLCGFPDFGEWIIKKFFHRFNCPAISKSSQDFCDT